MTKQIINSHKLIHVVSKDLERIEGCRRQMHKICKGLYYCQRPYLEARQCYKEHYWITQFGNTRKLEKN